MSGRPNKVEIAALKIAVSQMRQASKKSEQLNNLITELKNQDGEYRIAREKVFNLMSRMDVISNGNVGYEGRMAAFLMELIGED